MVTGKSLSLPNGLKIWRVLRRLLRLITVYLSKEEAINSKQRNEYPSLHNSKKKKPNPTPTISFVQLLFDDHVKVLLYPLRKFLSLKFCPSRSAEVIVDDISLADCAKTELGSVADMTLSSSQ